jgi:DtxR family Mn-dependent transcriptional regulator
MDFDLSSDDISEKMRDYLVEIYRLSSLGSETAFVGTSTLADLLLVTPPAVNRMVNRLREQGLLEHEPYKGIRLTAQGRREACLRLRAHRIAEVFLQNVMGFTWDQVYPEAARMGAGLGEPLLMRMLEMAGNPATCPHGEPIPQADGSIEAYSDFLLTQAKEGDSLLLTRVRTREGDRLNYLTALNLVPGTAFTLHHAAPFNGPMQLRLHNPEKHRDEFRIIGHNLAEQISVEHLSGTD